MKDYKNLFGLEDVGVDDKYSIKVEVPQYLPKNEKPSLDSLFDIRKYNELMTEINNSNVTDEEKEFLRFAATRHIVFTYSNIADYYAHASKEMQELMEHSALVIIDFDDALANGYIELTDKIYNIVKQSKEYQKKVEKYKDE